MCSNRVDDVYAARSSQNGVYMRTILRVNTGLTRPAFSSCTIQCYIGGVLLIIASWVRYAGTAKTLSVGGAYTLVIISQVCIRHAFHR